MEYILCCLGSVLCFICGVWAARGYILPCRTKRRDSEITGGEEDALSRDIAELMAYTIPRKERTDEED